MCGVELTAYWPLPIGEVSPYRNPTLNPERRPSQMYLAKAWSGWAASALTHALIFTGVETLDSTLALWGDNCL